MCFYFDFKIKRISDSHNIFSCLVACARRTPERKAKHVKDDIASYP